MMQLPCMVLVWEGFEIRLEGPKACVPVSGHEKSHPLGLVVVVGAVVLAILYEMDCMICIDLLPLGDVAAGVTQFQCHRGRAFRLLMVEALEDGWFPTSPPCGRVS